MKPLLLGISLLLATPAIADTKIEQLFPFGEQRCYTYSNELAPDGQVESFEMFRLFETDGLDEWMLGSVEEQAARDRNLASMTLTVQARFKAEKSAFWQVVSCGSGDKGIYCSVDCDGGSFTGAAGNNGLFIQFGERGLVMEGGCGDEGNATRFLSAKEAPSGLGLARQDLKACVAAKEKNLDVRLRDSVSLRKRIIDKGWKCLSRTYDAKYFEENPKHTVKQLAISILDPPKRIIEADSEPETKMRVSLKVTLRDGSSGFSEEECVASDESFVCGEKFRLMRRDGETALLRSTAFDPPQDETPPELKLADLKLGPYDKVFRLEASAKACD